MRIPQTCVICLRRFEDEFLHLACSRECEEKMLAYSENRRIKREGVPDEVLLWKGSTFCHDGGFVFS